MTFGISRDQGSFEWAGTSLSSVFAQPSNIVSPRMWRLLYDVVRFNAYALDLLRESDESEEDPAGGDQKPNGSPQLNKSKRPVKSPRSQQSIGEYCDQNGYCQAFRDDYLIPMTAAVWSTPPNQCTLNFPAITLVRFMYNHHLLSTFAHRPRWMTIPNGSIQYVEAVQKLVSEDKVHLQTPIAGIEDINGKLILQFENDEEDLFDHVVLACHGDQAYGIIEYGGTQEERDILSCFKTTENIAYLHNDVSLMPRRRAVWSSWNLLTSTEKTGSASTDPALVSLVYNMNILQHIPADKYSDVLVSLNPPREPKEGSVQGRWIYHHPLYSSSAIRAQKMLPRIQNTRGISYAGAWTRYGFHEDGFSSGVAVAMEHLGAKIPFGFVDATFIRGRRPAYTFGDWILRFVVYWLSWLVATLDTFVYAVEPWWWAIKWAARTTGNILGIVVRGTTVKKDKRSIAGVKAEKRPI